MSRSWDHAVRPLTSDEIAAASARAHKARTAPMPLGWSRGEADWEKWGEREALFLEGCRMAGACREIATHEISYSYVTGRRGRSSDAQKRACATHAEKFAAKHGLVFVGSAA